MKPFLYCPYCRAALKKKKFNGIIRRYCPDCEFIQYRNPVPSVGALAVNNNSEILLIKRGREPKIGVWVPPSGFIELGETAEETCLRELKEETGMEGKIEKLLGVFLENTELYGDNLVVMYQVRVTGGKLQAGDDASDARFFSLSDLPDLTFNCFKKSLKNLKLSLD